MSTLKVNKLRDTAGSADAIVLDPNGGAVLAGVTTVTSVKVGAAVTISESGIEASGIGITVANINGGAIGGRRNLVINGSMLIAQRGTSSTDNGFATLDRFKVSYNGTDESPTQAQVDVSSGTTPYTEGFRKALKITNGDQTSVGASDYIQIDTRLEAQDIANSGWNYTSTSSFITLSFWIKSSVAQKFQCSLHSNDGTAQAFMFETPTLVANTWTKIKKTIPGNSNLTFANDNGLGLLLFFFPYIGTTYTSGSNTLNAWGAAAGTSYGVTDDTSWWLEDNATFEMTGVQLEVGSQATAFEHRSHGEETTLCQRYFQQVTGDGINVGLGFYYQSSYMQFLYRFPVEMRTTPTVDDITGTHYYVIYREGSADTFNSVTIDNGTNNQQCLMYNNSEVTGSVGATGIVRCNNAAPSGGQIQFNAEL